LTSQFQDSGRGHDVVSGKKCCHLVSEHETSGAI